MIRPESIISARPEETRNILQKEYDAGRYLDIAEFYSDTIQGEGINIGHPAAFLRLQNCTLNCKWCDTKSVWRHGNPYTFDELLIRMNLAGLVQSLREGQKLVITGGSPLMQQEPLILFLKAFEYTHNFIPDIEIENECVLIPDPDLVKLVTTWNNSPKLNNSRNGKFLRYRPDVIKYMSNLGNSWFKFVVYEPGDWDEIQKDFITPGLIRKDQIILMPRGETMEELEKNREFVISLAIRENVRYCTREHVVVWGEATGV